MLYGIKGAFLPEPAFEIDAQLLLLTQLMRVAIYEKE